MSFVSLQSLEWLLFIFANHKPPPFPKHHHVKNNKNLCCFSSTYMRNEHLFYGYYVGSNFRNFTISAFSEFSFKSISNKVKFSSYELKCFEIRALNNSYM